MHSLDLTSRDPWLTSPSHSLYAAHIHITQSNLNPQGPPGAISPEAPGPSDALPVSQINEDFMNRRQRMHDRLEAQSRGYESIFSQ